MFLFVLLSKLFFFRQFLLGPLWIKKLTFVGTLVFSFIINIVLLIVTNLLIFPSVSPRLSIWSMQRHFMRSAGKYSTTLKISSTKTFSCVNQKIFDRKSWYASYASYTSSFSITEILETQEGSPIEFFCSMRQKKLWWKNVIPPLIKAFR